MGKVVRVDRYDFPDDLHYWKDHTWAKIEEDGKRVRVGVDAMGQDMAGKLLFIRIRPVGSVVKQGATFASIETGKWVGPLRSPINGTIIELNQALSRKPSLVNEDSYGGGWLVVMQPSSLEDDVKSLLRGDAWVEFVKKDMVERVKK